MSGRSLRRTAWSLFAPFLGLAVVLGIFWLYGKVAKPDTTFLSGFRLALIAKQTAIVGMGALGMTVVIIAGGIDLSVGSLLALTSVALASLLDIFPYEEASGAVQVFWPLAAVLGTILVGLAAGALNGILITGLRLVPFIVTLGTMLLFRGVAEDISGQKKVQAEAPGWLSSLLDPPGQESWQMVCTGVWIVLVLGILLAILLRYTVFGRYVFAVGSNESTARLCGVPVGWVKIAVYGLGGLFMALAGVLEFNNLNSQGNPTSGIGLELEIIAAVVIGGGSLHGGRGSVLGSLIGALLMTTLRSGCVYAEVPDPVQKILIGAIIIGAVALDQIRHRKG